MPSTRHDKKLIKVMVPGTRVEHWREGPGTVTTLGAEGNMVPVLLHSDGTTAYFYPINLLGVHYPDDDYVKAWVREHRALTAAQRISEGPVDNVGWGPFALPGERKGLREAEAARMREMTEGGT